MSTIFRIIYSIIQYVLTLPWWLIIIIIAVLCIIGGWEDILAKLEETGKKTRKTKERSDGRRRISQQMNSDPESAVETAEEKWKSGAFEDVEYENCLLDIVQKTGCTDAMAKLAEFYSTHDNDEKCKHWQKKAAEAGNVDCIMEYYGFSDYDVSSNAHEEILNVLDKVRIDSEDGKALVDYHKGIVNYKMGRIDAAKQLFTSITYMEIEHDRKYMLFKCLVAEKHMEEAEKILDELEDNEFEVSAADYLSLYNYYDKEKGTAKEDYDKALIFASKYAETEDADSDVSNEIMGNIYYKFAVAIQNGSNGFEKDTRQCIEFYTKSAKYGNVNALGYAGLLLWNGGYDDVFTYRNYREANRCFVKAAQKGHKMSREILSKYGVEGTLVLPMDAKKVTYQFMDGHKLTASASNMKWLQLDKGIRYQAGIISDEFVTIYRNGFKSFDELFNGIHKLYAEQVAKMLKWCIQLLMFFNIDTYSADRILEECEDLSLLPRVPKFEQALDKIDNRAAELNMQTAYAKASRRQWSGAGFGTTIRGTINASVKASVAAGAMNIGSGILHGIGDSIVAAINNSEIKGMGKAVFENPNTIKEFEIAVLTACLDVGITVRDIIAEQHKLALDELGGKIRLGNEELNKISEEVLDAKIINNLSAKKYEYTYALMMEKLRRFPYDNETLEGLYMLTIQRIRLLDDDNPEMEDSLKTIGQYAGDFGISLNKIKKEVAKQLED